MEQNRHHAHLSLEKRRQIYFLLGRKMPVTTIARELGRHHSTIYRELQRNTYWDDDDRAMNGYFPLSAQEYSRRRRQRLHLFEQHPELKAFVIEKLKVYWSQDQIAGYLKRLGHAVFYACAETIYQFVYGGEGALLGLHRYLFKGRKRRRSVFRRKPRIALVPEQHGIAFRPDSVDDRRQIGHWSVI